MTHLNVSGPTAKNVQATWAKTKERVGTAFIIDGAGLIHQCFSSNHWAHHLGTRLLNNVVLNQQSIGIEICNWGGLKRKGNRFFSLTGKEIPKEEVVDYGIEKKRISILPAIQTTAARNPQNTPAVPHRTLQHTQHVFPRYLGIQPKRHRRSTKDLYACIV